MSAPMEEWKDAGEIEAVTFRDVDGECVYKVGDLGVTRIDKHQKAGLHANIAYVRVWMGDHLRAELCQHALTGVFFKVPA